MFMMFLVSDVHPFNDGNGRVSRIMMNAELYSENLSTIIIPNVYRAEYLGALKSLTQRSNPEPYIKMLMAAHLFSNLDFSEYLKIKTLLDEKNWFQEPDSANLVR
jgi:Fic family protein